MPNCSVDWTATGTVLQALATLLLAGLAFWAGRSASQSAKTASEAVTDEWARREEDRKRALAAQASRFYATRIDAGSNAKNLREPSMTVTNGSDLPIYDVVAVVTPITSGDNLEWFSKHGNICQELKVAEVMPHESEPLSVTHGELRIKWGWDYVRDDSSGVSRYELPDGVHMSGFTTSLYFRDASGLSWQRDPKGILSRTPDPTAADPTAADNTGP